MKKLYLFLILLCALSKVKAQNQGISNIWLSGYESQYGYPGGNNKLDFQTGNFSVMADSLPMSFGVSHTNICDSMGNILFMGLVGLIIANLINMFMQNAAFDMVIASFGVGIFAMLTAYDVQNLKKYSHMVLASPEDSGKFALMGAISLYMNLINIFLYLLRLFGDKRRD